MSRGIGASAFKIFEDENTVKYAYGSYNLNKPEYRNAEEIRDGEITISKICFSEFDTSDVFEMVCSKKITVNNCSNCWKVVPDIQTDFMVFHVLFKLFHVIYEREKIIPEKIYYDV